MIPSFKDLSRKTLKALRLLQTPRYRRGLRQGVAATIEPLGALARLNVKTVIDVGAHKGQFSLLALEIVPSARVYSFEPQTKPREHFQRVLNGEERVRLFPAAIGPNDISMPMNISASDDSSSLLPISEQQIRFFPGTGAVDSETVRVAPLHHFLSEKEIIRPALLKIDVQGFELEVLEGCARLLSLFDLIYVECSFVEMYTGQALASEIFEWLHRRKFRFAGVYNVIYNSEGTAIQGDFLFQR